MPNHVTTRCVVTGGPERLAEFRATMFVGPTDPADDPGPHFSFSGILPMPKCLEGTQSPIPEVGLAIIEIDELGGGDFDSPAVSPKVKEVIHNWLTYQFVREMNITEPAAFIDWYRRERGDEIEEGRKTLAAQKETSFPSWYDWATANWGTKWNAYSTAIVSEAPGRLEFKFDTAWSFPKPVFAKLAERWPDLEFKTVSFDEGWNFACRGRFHGEDQSIESMDATDELYAEVYGRSRRQEAEDYVTAALAGILDACSSQGPPDSTTQYEIADDRLFDGECALDSIEAFDDAASAPPAATLRELVECCRQQSPEGTTSRYTIAPDRLERARAALSAVAP